MHIASMSGFAQTTIIAARDASEVIMAADSKGTPLEDASRFVKVCKILTCGNLLVGIAGIREAAISGISFKIPPIVEEVCRANRVTQDKVMNLERLVMPPLTELLKEIRRRDIAYYGGLVQMRAVVNVVFIGFENNIPFIISRNFLTPATIEETVVVTVSGSDQTSLLPAGQIDYVFAGHHEGISEFVKTRNDFWRAGLIEGAKFLVTYMIADRADVVGFPIDIVRLDKSGVKWVQRKPECEEKKEPKPNARKRRRS